MFPPTTTTHTIIILHILLLLLLLNPRSSAFLNQPFLQSRIGSVASQSVSQLVTVCRWARHRPVRLPTICLVFPPSNNPPDECWLQQPWHPLLNGRLSLVWWFPDARNMSHHQGNTSNSSLFSHHQGNTSNSTQFSHHQGNISNSSQFSHHQGNTSNSSQFVEEVQGTCFYWIQFQT